MGKSGGEGEKEYGGKRGFGGEKGEGGVNRWIRWRGEFGVEGVGNS